MLIQDKRTTPGLLYHCFYAIGYSLLSPVGYYIKNYQTVSWILALPSLLFLPYYFFVDESVQWLLSQKRVDDAEKIVAKAVSQNGASVETPIFTAEISDDDIKKKPSALKSFVSMFGEIWSVMTGPYPKLRLRFAAIFLIWAINSGSYYGLTLNTKNLGGAFYINLLISALVEIPAICLIIIAVMIWDIGRRKILIVSYLFCGILNLLVACIQAGWFLDPETDAGKTLIITLGKCSFHLWSSNFF